MRNVLCIVPRSKRALNFIRKYSKRVSSTCVDHGIDISKFKYSLSKENQFIYVGQLIERKNIKAIIDKFFRYHIKYDQNSNLLIIGRGPQREELIDYINKKGLSESISIIDFMPRTKLNKYLKSSIAMLIDTKNDNNLVTVPECICSGTPIVTNLVPTNASMIADNGLGIAKKEWNEDDLNEISVYCQQYSKRCVEYRDKLTNIYSANQFIMIFNQYKQ